MVVDQTGMSGLCELGSREDAHFGTGTGPVTGVAFAWTAARAASSGSAASTGSAWD